MGSVVKNIVGGSNKKEPPAPPPQAAELPSPPKESDPAAAAARAKERLRASQAVGRGKTILTAGLDEASTSKKTILGS